MSEEDLKMLQAAFARIKRECNTPERARAQLQSEGLLDENGKLPQMYRPLRDGETWQ